MDKEQLIINSYDEAKTYEEHSVELSKPLRGPSLDGFVDLGVTMRDEFGDNAETGISFRDAESLSTNCRLHNLKEHAYPFGSNGESQSESTHLKLVDSLSLINNHETLLKSPLRPCTFSSPEESGHQHEDEVQFAHVSSFNGHDDQSDSLTSSEAAYINTVPVMANRGIAPPLSGGKKYHVFFSYEIADRDWVEEFVRKLESPELGFRCSMHERDFHAGKRIIENITEHIRASEKTVLVLSPDFIQSHWCMFEIELGMVLSMEERQLLVVPVMVRQCDVPDSIKTLTYIDATLGNDWWHRFMDAITTKDNLSADFTGTRDFAIRPRYGNMDCLTELSSSFKWFSGEAVRTPYIPDVLTRPGIQISVEEFDQAFDIIRSSSRCLCKCMCDITGSCMSIFLWLLFGCFLVSVLFWLSYSSQDSNITISKGGTVVTITALQCAWMAMIVVFFVQRFLRKRKLKRGVNEANKVLLKNNVILGFKVETSVCMLFRIKIIVWYCNTSECQRTLTAFLRGKEQFKVNANCEEICQALAKMLIYRHSTEYTSAYIDGKLIPKHGIRHVRNAACLCQYIEQNYANEKKIPDSLC